DGVMWCFKSSKLRDLLAYIRSQTIPYSHNSHSVRSGKCAGLEEDHFYQSSVYRTCRSGNFEPSD
ncbi:hypothetical protein NPIL_702571, partial [Nephila pilipes]